MQLSYQWLPANWWSGERVLLDGPREVARLRPSGWWRGRWEVQVGGRRWRVRRDGPFSFRFILEDAAGAGRATLRPTWRGSETKWSDGRAFTWKTASLWGATLVLDDGRGPVAEFRVGAWSGRGAVRRLAAEERLPEETLALMVALQAVVLAARTHAGAGGAVMAATH